MTDERIVWSPLPGSQTLAMSCPAQIIIYHGSRGPGKGLPLDEPVYTERGPVHIGNLKVGDTVACPDGSSSKIIGVYPQGVRPVYEITFFDGSIARCDDQHIWPIHTQDGNTGGSKVEYGYSLMTMDQVIERFNTNICKLHVPTLDSLKMRYKVHFSNNKLPVDPYLLGLILGDGTFSQNGSYCTVDDQLAEYVLLNGGVRWSNDKRYELQNIGFSKDLQSKLTLLNMKDCRSHTKFIPESYLHHTDENRLAILQGLMDTDGTIDKSGYMVFNSASEELSKGVQYLVRSLGGNATLTRKPSYIKEVRYKDTFEVYIQPGNKFIPFRLERKVSRIKPYMHKKLWKRIESIVRLDDAETVCIKIDHPLGLFITRDFVVTHNTDSQLMRFRAKVGQGYGRHWRGVIFDREYKNLDDLVSKSQRWFPEFKDNCRFINSKSDYKWIWKTGEELLFRTVKKDSDYWGFHGQEFPFIGWNELTKFPTQNLFEMMMSCNRSSFRPEDFPYYINGDYLAKKGIIQYVQANHKFAVKQFLPEIPLEVFATCNPHGSGHNWIKRRFINASKMGQILKNSVNVYNPKTQKREDVVKTQTHIFGSYRENKYLSPEYVATLESIDEPNKRRAWLMGDWDVVAGGMFDDLWDSKVHIVEPFEIPSTWRIDRSFDWGSSHPFSVGWWAESDGCDITLADGSIRRTIRGDLFRINEWYGWNGRPNEGLRMLGGEIAKGIIEREVNWKIHSRCHPGAADNSIYDVENGNSIAASMANPIRINGNNYPGVMWTRSDKSSGSRKAGWEKIRLYLKQAKPEVIIDPETKQKQSLPREKPGLFVFNNCKMFIDLVPILPRDELDPDDVDTDAEDHVGDEVRYRVLSVGLGARGGRTKGAQ
jgi:hypothetical protein